MSDSKKRNCRQNAWGSWSNSRSFWSLRRGVAKARIATKSWRHTARLIYAAQFSYSQSVATPLSSRYPGVSEEVSEEEYRRAIELAERVVEWAEAIIYSFVFDEPEPLSG